MMNVKKRPEKSEDVILDSEFDLSEAGSEPVPAENLKLIEACADGDPDALQQFFENYAEDIYNFPIKVFQLDEDAASDFFLYAFERLKDGNRFRSFQGRSTFRTWFYTVLRNLVIDWMRTIREVKTVNLNQKDEHGNTRTIEHAPDPRASVQEERDKIEQMIEFLESVPTELRVIFKLSYIYYIDLNSDELAYIVDKSGLAEKEILQKLAQLKHELSRKEMKNIESEDKITALYISILDLKTKIERLESQPADRDEYELERLEKTIEKKYNQRDRLLEKKSKGLFVVRAPYRFIADLLQIPEGSVSVHMMRAMEKLRGGTEI